MTEPIIDARLPASSPPADADASTADGEAGSHVVSGLLAIAVTLSTMLAIVALAVLMLMTPLYMHGALDRAGSAGFLGTSATYAHDVSDATVSELILGPGTFVAPPLSDGRIDFYDASEASHLRDARAVLYGLLGLSALGVVILAVGFIRSRRRARYWRAVAAGSGILGVAFIVIGALFLVAFDAAFTLFHEIFFPGGNWSFDFTTQRLVQLYPIPFWEEATTVLGAIVIGVSAVTWFLARRRSRRLAAAGTS